MSIEIRFVTRDQANKADLGFDVSDAAFARARARNIAKLASRAERGVIQGSGGDR